MAEELRPIIHSRLIDQAHEQNNKCVKGDVGAVGLTQNSVQLPHWMMSGPEILRAINDFESSLVCNHSKDFDICHHKQFRGVQSTFRNKVKSLCDTIIEMGNPFLQKTSLY